MGRIATLSAWFALSGFGLLTALSLERAVAEEPTKTPASATDSTAPVAVEGNHFQAASKNFLVRSFDRSYPADQVAGETERLRTALQQQWLGTVEPTWRPACEVVIHASEWEYLRQVGWAVAPSRGACQILRDGGRIVGRRVDLFADPQTKQLGALAHELTHVVLADRFGHAPPPRWADEGIALVADGTRKQRLHLRDVRRALESRRCPRITETLERQSYPQGPELAAFYGQSLSLVNYLSAIDEPAKVVEMVTLAQQCGYERALECTYGIKGTAELERRWLSYLSQEMVAHRP